MGKCAFAMPIRQLLLLIESKLAVNCHHGIKQILIMTFLEIIPAIILYVICVAWQRTPSTTSFIVESLRLKGRF